MIIILYIAMVTCCLYILWYIVFLLSLEEWEMDREGSGILTLGEFFPTLQRVGAVDQKSLYADQSISCQVWETEFRRLNDIIIHLIFF